MTRARAMDCPQCGATLSGTGQATAVACEFCGAEVRVYLTPVESTQRTLDKRAALEPQMNALMDRYARRLAGQDAEGALPYYEAFTFLTLSLGYEVDALSELEPMVASLMKDAAGQLGVEYRSPTQRGETVTWESVAALANAPA